RQAVDAGISRCTDCGQICAPWSKWCDACYRRGGWHYDDWDDDREDYEDDERDYLPAKTPKLTDRQEQRARERNARSAKLDSEIAAVAGSDGTLARPKGAPRSLWWEQALPALLAVNGGERHALRSAMNRTLKTWRPTVDAMGDFAERARALMAEPHPPAGHPGPSR
ncbi:MAG: hypothetical protein ACYDEA_07630, partial [Candidatus Dormibacteria bacterium]